MRCQIYTPAPPLAAFVSRYWIMRGPASGLAGLEHTIVPNGRMKILFNLADNFAVEYGRYRGLIPGGPIVVGQMRAPAVVISTGSVGVLGVEFRPAGALPLLRAPLHELSGELVGMADLILPGWQNELHERLLGAADDAARIALLEEALLALPGRGGTAKWDARLAAGLEQVERFATLGDLQEVGDLARALGVSTRSLERRFREQVGLSPKQMHRVLRLQLALGLARTQPEWTGARLAQEAGYFDQAHFIKDFQSLTGSTPMAFRQRQTAIAAAFAGTAPGEF